MGVVQSGSDGAGRDAERLGDLGRFQPEVVAQNEDRPLFGRQPFEGPLQLVALGDGDAPGSAESGSTAASSGTTWIAARRDARDVS